MTGPYVGIGLNELPLATPLTGIEIVPILQSGQTRQTTTSSSGLSGKSKQGTVFIGTPSNQTITLISYAEYAFTLIELDNLHVSAGSITLTINQNGGAMAGLNGLAVTTVSQSPTSNTLVSPGDRITMTLSSNASSVGLEFTMKGSL
jgi:hypothetical protein